MELQINNKKVENPFIAALLVLFSLTIVAGVVALIFFVLLPLIGIVISAFLGLVLVILTPIFFWLAVPVFMLSIIGWCFGKLLKD